MKQVIGKRSVTIAVSKQVIETGTSSTGGEWSSSRAVPSGTLTGTVELRIDIDRLLLVLGAKALRGKPGRTRLAGGLIEVVADKTTLKRLP